VAKTILTISVVDDVYYYMEIERQPSGLFPHTPQTATTPQALLAACRKADEIYINSVFPSALYQWGVFPKVAKKHLYTLVGRDAHEKVHIPERLYVEYKVIKDVMEGGASKYQLAYTGIPEQDVLSIWNQFADVRNKVKHYTTTPVSIATAINTIDKPGDSFMSVVVGEKSSIIQITNKDGVVEVARSVPVGFTKGEISSDPAVSANFAQDLDREISMTITFFKQEFRRKSPGLVYMLGNPHLEFIAGNNPIATLQGMTVKYVLQPANVQGMTPEQFSENIQLLGNVYNTDDFNFIPKREHVARRVSAAVNAAYAAAAAAIVLALIWAWFLTSENSLAARKYTDTLNDHRNMEKRVAALREDFRVLSPVIGWRDLYENHLKNKPDWNMFLSEVAILIPDEIIIKSMQVKPDRNNTRRWKTLMAGTVNARNWQEALSLIRVFGGKLQSSPLYKVEDIKYSPDEMKAGTKSFDFQMDLNLLPRGSKNES